MKNFGKILKELGLTLLGAVLLLLVLIYLNVSSKYVETFMGLGIKIEIWLIFYLVSISGLAILIGSVILFLILRINNIVEVFTEFKDIFNQWKFKEFIVNESDFPPPTEEKIVFGVDFGITGGETAESNEYRAKLRNILTNKNIKHVIYICTRSSDQGEGETMLNINSFLDKIKNDSEYSTAVKEKMQIYLIRTDFSQPRISIVDHKVLYQPCLIGSDNFNNLIKDIAIKIDDDVFARGLEKELVQFQKPQEEILKKLGFKRVNDRGLNDMEPKIRG